MRTIRIRSKRRATLPKQLCEELGVGPGDELDLERRTVDGEAVWVIRAVRPDWSWVGAARSYAAGKSHDWEEIEDSVARGLAG